MKITTEIVKRFEDDQQTYGTRTALWNLLWLNARQQYRDLGIVRVRTTERGERTRERKRAIKGRKQKTVRHANG